MGTPQSASSTVYLTLFLLFPLSPSACSRSVCSLVLPWRHTMTASHCTPRLGNKRVTRIVGLEAFLADPEQVAAACQKKFATATTMSPLPGKQATGVEVVVQGAVAEKLPDWLAADFGIPKRYVHVPKADAK